MEAYGLKGTVTTIIHPVKLLISEEVVMSGLMREVQS